MRNIYLIGPLLAPTDTKTGGRIHYLCKLLAESGFKVTIFDTATLNIPSNSRIKTVDKIDYINYSGITKKKRSSFPENT
jgi:hypothetical protein